MTPSKTNAEASSAELRCRFCGVEHMPGDCPTTVEQRQKLKARHNMSGRYRYQSDNVVRPDRDVLADPEYVDCLVGIADNTDRVLDLSSVDRIVKGSEMRVIRFMQKHGEERVWLSDRLRTLFERYMELEGKDDE